MARAEQLRRPVLLPFAVWLLHMALPLLGLWLLIAKPSIDVKWENHQAHFWLVVGAAAINVGLAARVNEDARRRADARLFLVSLAFVTAAGFLGLHALATPGVLLAGKNTGFVIATPVGLFVAGALALLSSLDYSPAAASWVIAHQRLGRLMVVAILGGWAAVSLSGASLLGRDLPPTEAQGPLLLAAAAGSLLYVMAAVRYYLLHRRRPAAVLLSVITSFVLLAESMVAIAYARNWQTSWWEWHVLMVLAFGFVAYSAHQQYRREGTRSGLFTSIALEQTLAEVRQEHTAALEALVDAMEHGERTGPVTARLADRFDLTERQVQVLERGAEALAHEREQLRRLGALVAIGREASVIRAEDDLLDKATHVIRQAFGRESIRLGVVRSGALVFPEGDTDSTHQRALDPGEPVETGGTLLLPLAVKGHPAGLLEVRSPTGGFAERDRSVLLSLAAQLSIAIENARLYQQLDGLFRSYMSPDVATSLLADPTQARLGGAVAEVTVLMADLQGFTPFAERTDPAAVVSMLNAYYGQVVPQILDSGGTVVQFVGDAVMALFNAPVPQPDHALRACRAGLAIQATTKAIAQPDWPPFRVGVNTGPALVGNIGSEHMRNFTAIGDTTNLAARLQTAAPPGEVVISATTHRALGSTGHVRPLGHLTVKGKADPVDAFILTALA
ncbi:Adenylate cyclase, class 3 [Actinokineospora alba]|uniref:Adenylate cyclase, class 3 n=1 Tax=Actinokineospora alba TaxID=504798 RepID=A0A1H0QTN1_9PSEU|nr:adenylate/guanylate cyclase domain-containing protein [Actinokineospora alba]TDP70399.1 class 3 adenylate cyclase [Actinokineospora alba]SDI32552.1 Adenylate cyclase, class 3 [Actinokineospora alba]SDP20662.1 Adenylate cyclase, class 3 [Actinokineospora alba]